MLVDLLMFVPLVLFAPYILVGVVLAKILVEADKIFRLPMLGAGVSLAGLSAIAWMHSTPDPEAKFQSIVEVFAQASPLGIPMPYLCIALAAGLITASIRWSRPTAT